MATPHDKPVLRRAVVFLNDFIASRALTPGDKLPPMQHLAGLAGVSCLTMGKALREAAACGLLSRVRCRFFVAGNPPSGHCQGQSVGSPLPYALSPPRPWRRVADAIVDDIKNGAFRPGAHLPSIKELQARYAVSFKTLKKALGRLVTEESLEQLPNGGFAAPSPTTGAWRPSIVCIIGSPDSQRMAFGQNDEALFRALESLCEHARIRLDNYLQYFDRSSDRYTFRQLRTGRLHVTEDLAAIGDDTVQGFIYFLIWRPQHEDERAIGALLANKKPVAVLDESSVLRLHSGMADTRRLRLFTAAASREPARIVAAHLRSLGHRRIAFLSADHQYVWSHLRLEGLTSGPAAAGRNGGVRAFVIDTSDILDQAAQRCDFASFVKFYEQWVAALPAPYRSEFDLALERLRWETGPRAEQHLLLEPLFEEALADPTITAWVAVNDTTASAALAFLKRKDVRVPADLSVLSFDDSPTALISNLSSYNFNVQALAAAMLGFMLGRRPYSEADAGVRGFIVDRGSTGPARKVIGDQ